jgi:hypothetical protein
MRACRLGDQAWEERESETLYLNIIQPGSSPSAQHAADDLSGRFKVSIRLS